MIKNTVQRKKFGKNNNKNPGCPDMIALITSKTGISQYWTIRIFKYFENILKNLYLNIKLIQKFNPSLK